MIHAGTEVRLSILEAVVASVIAGFRQQNGSTNGRITDRAVDGKRSGFDLHFEGALGELAFARLVNVYPDFGVGIANGPVDCHLPDDTAVDVKCTRVAYGALMAPPHKNDRRQPGVYVLMTGTFPVFTFRGMATADELIRPENIDPRWRGAYTLAQDRLRPLNPFAGFGVGE
jgi:hypothetical protein